MSNIIFRMVRDGDMSLVMGNVEYSTHMRNVITVGDMIRFYENGGFDDED